MQSDWNSFCGDVGWDSVNQAFRDEEGIYTKCMYDKQKYLDFYYWRFKFFKVIEEYAF